MGQLKHPKMKGCAHPLCGRQGGDAAHLDSGLPRVCRASPSMLIPTVMKISISQQTVPFSHGKKLFKLKTLWFFFFLSLPFTLTSFSWHISELKEKKIYSGKGRGRTHPAKILPTASVTILLFCHHKHTRCECLLSCHRHLLLGTEGAPGWDWRPMQTRASRTAPGFLGG